MKADLENTLYKTGSAFEEKCSKYAFYALLLYFVDIILLGTGGLTKIGPLSTRILFFGIAGLLSLPILFRNIKKLIKTPVVLFSAAFFVWMVIGGVIGFVKGNRTDIIKSDFMGYMNLLLLPTMLVIINSKERLNTLFKAIAYSCGAVSVGAILLSFTNLMPFRDPLRHWLTDVGLCALSGMTSVAVRVFFHTGSRYMFAGLLIAFYFLLTEKGDRKRSLHWCGLMSLYIVGIFLSYTRAIYAACFVVAVAAFVFAAVSKKGLWKRILKAFGFAAACAVLFIILLGGVQKGQNLIKVAFYRILLSTDLPSSMVGDDGGLIDTSDGEMDKISEDVQLGSEIRQAKKILLSESIVKSPVIGNGLGAAIKYHPEILDRIEFEKEEEDASGDASGAAAAASANAAAIEKSLRSGYVEYFYHDIINKLGIIGLALYLAPYIWMAVTTLRAGKSKHLMVSIAAFGSISYFFVIAYFNPCMNTTVGISCYMLAMTVMNMVSGDMEKTDK
ncbi:MAG: hypothetical protein E7546_00325 [Ruminococcaceae bacterium]|nr:hypothetical protein [Oscillospiraceae bacterium]